VVQQAAHAYNQSRQGRPIPQEGQEPPVGVMCRAVAASVCEHFRVADVEHLGHGSIEPLLQHVWNRHREHAGAPSSGCSATQRIPLRASRVAACALACGAPPTVAEQGMLGLQADDVECLLRSAPLLAELSQCVPWEEVASRGQAWGRLRGARGKAPLVQAVDEAAGAKDPPNRASCLVVSNHVQL